jgi:REP element-mobilizing transposase RayT
MIHNPDKYHHQSIRLKDYDYTQAGAYFITICTHNRKCVLGDVVNGEMRLNELGQVVEIEWLRTAEIRDNVELDAFVIMPNHIHGIVVITEPHVGATDNCRGTARRAPTEQFGKPTSGSLPTIIRSFKSAVTKHVNEMRHTPGIPIWQRSYYEHIIRNEDEVHQIQVYIVNNPLRWELDSENPKNMKRRGLV